MTAAVYLTKRLKAGAGLVFALLLLGCQGNDYTALSPDTARAAYQANPASFLDVRSQAEWDGAHLAGAQHIPLDQLEQKIASVFPDKNQPIVSYCRSGRRASAATQTLLAMGYKQLSVVVPGGYAELKRAGLPVVER